MRRQGSWIMKCTECHKRYDLVKATDRAGDDNLIKCPNCGVVVGKRNS